MAILSFTFITASLKLFVSASHSNRKARFSGPRGGKLKERNPPFYPTIPFSLLF